VRFDTLSATTDSARIHLTIDASHDAALVVEVILTDPDGAVVFNRTCQPGDASGALLIDKPRLWWTADLGEQPLYGLTVRLFDGDRLVDEVARSSASAPSNSTSLQTRTSRARPSSASC
jgi:beta-galactosidase/beta-glucuronidase